MSLETVRSGRDEWLKEGCRLQSLGRWAESLACFEEAVRSSPRDLQTLVQLGFVLIQLREWRRAAETYEKIVALLPKDHRVWCNLSYLYEHAGDLSKAEDRARKAIRLSPTCAEAWNNLGMALRSPHRFAEAIQAFRQAISRQTDFSLAEFNLATTQLLLGNTDLGWPGYERRTVLSEARLRQPLAPRWTGDALSGKTLLIYSDQGLGDLLQFSRLLPEVRERSQAKIVVSSHPELLLLMQHIRGADEVVGLDAEPHDAAAEIAVASLPSALRLDLRHIPGTVPYLTPPALELSQPLVEIFREIPPGIRRIGLVWQGNPTQNLDYIRSLPLRRLLPLAEVPGVRWLSLQVNEAGQSQLAEVASSWRLTNVGERLQHFTDTAAVLQHLDLVITVDTAMAHLAGALARPVWTLLNHTPDWRWGLTGETSPWYPSMRLFRQPRPGDWDTVVAQVKQELIDSP